MEEKRIDLRQDTEEIKKIMAETKRSTQLCFKINSTMPMTEESNALVQELFAEFGEGSSVQPPIHVVRGNSVEVGKNVIIMYNFLGMSAGGIIIEDNALIAANVSLITNNHDYDVHEILLCKPIHIKKNAWIGAGATILPGVTVGENSVVAAGAVVNKDVPDHVVVGGIPAKIIKNLK